MIAKRTVVSASLGVLLGGSTVTAIADPDEQPAHATGDGQIELTSRLVGEARCDTYAHDPVTGDGDAPGCVEPAPPPPQPPPPPATPPGVAPKRRLTGRFEVGAGYSTDDKFMAAASIAQDDLFRTGLHLSLTAKLSARRQLFLTRFADPHVLGSDLSIAADLYNDRRHLPGFERGAAGGALSLVHPLGAHLRGFVGYRIEDVTVTPDDGLAARTLGTGSGLQLHGGLLASVRAGLAYSTLDAPVLPTRGTSAGVAVEVADPRLGSEIQLARVNGWLSHHQALGAATLHLSGTIAAVTSRDPLGVPLSERLQLDGSSDIRGYAPGSLGPVDPVSGRPLGGNLELTGRAELEVPVIPQSGISVAGFFDAGGIYDLDGRGSAGYSAGVGASWRSPLGPLRFDVAFPLDGGKPRFLLSLGGAF